MFSECCPFPALLLKELFYEVAAKSRLSSYYCSVFGVSHSFHKPHPNFGINLKKKTTPNLLSQKGECCCLPGFHYTSGEKTLGQNPLRGFIATFAINVYEYNDPTVLTFFSVCLKND